MASVIHLCAIFLLFGVCAANYVSELQEVKNSPAPVTEVCLGCLCQAVSGCKQGLQCEGDHCGLFRITWAYWADAGKPTLNGQSPDDSTAYPNCTNDPYCAALAVQGYMKKFAQMAMSELQEVKNSPAPVTEVCLGCLCQAVSGCKQGLQCEGDHCGLFRITWAYWADAGKPTLNGQSPDDSTAYPNCTNDPYCAALAVQGYMKKFAQDCNGDGVINCYDYIAIHKKGGYGCSGELPFQYVTTFNQCIDAVANAQRQGK